MDDATLGEREVCLGVDEELHALLGSPDRARHASILPLYDEYVRHSAGITRR
jgi:hypothetical protein